MPVPQHVLNWLYSVLTSEYHDVNRTYNDIAQALAIYPTLSPRTDVHTFRDGSSALLVRVSGTLPVAFRGATYRFPISLWVPYAYPKEAPFIYVTPTENMLVRPGQHVDPQGQVYHPYLSAWPDFWDKSTIVDFLAILTDVFTKEPPVIARPPPGQQQRQHTGQQQQQPPQPPSRPPRPTSTSNSITNTSPGQGDARPPLSATRSPLQAPPPPPKAPLAAASGVLQQPQTSATPSLSPTPPIPPREPQHGSDSGAAPTPAERAAQNRQSRYKSAPPLPPPAASQPPAFVQPPHHAIPNAYAPHPRPHPQPHHIQHPSLSQPLPSPRQWQSPPPQHAHHMVPQPEPPARRPPPPDLLDEPLSTADSSPKPNVPAPPIPPNPEKDALLRQLGRALHSYREHNRQRNDASMAGLQAQRAAMAAAFNTLNAERASLAQVSSLLASNAGILREALRRGDAVLEGSRAHREPDIDQILVAPTAVANQLYTLVAEERAIGDAVFVLGRAVERGRVAPAVFARTVRSLAREWYLKKALVRKIGRGMGLAL